MIKPLNCLHFTLINDSWQCETNWLNDWLIDWLSVTEWASKWVSEQVGEWVWVREREREREREGERGSEREKQKERRQRKHSSIGHINLVHGECKEICRSFILLITCIFTDRTNSQTHTPLIDIIITSMQHSSRFYITQDPVPLSIVQGL